MRDAFRRRGMVLFVAAIAIPAIAIGAVALVARAHPASARPPPRSIGVTAFPDAPASPMASAKPTASPAAARWSWTPLPAATASFVPAELVIAKLRVRAAVEVKDVDSHNQMQPPDRPGDAAWYRFTARPGTGSNAVFAAHRDFAGVGPAIFWHLDQLVADDLVEVASDQRTEIAYRVAVVRDYGLHEIPMRDVLAADQRDEITLITCSGRYTASAGYDHRLVVRAVRA